MGLLIIAGPYGSGKTLFATLLLNLQRGHLAYANYKTTIPNVHEFDLREFLSGHYKKCNIVLDEAYLYLESRLSSRGLNRALSYLLFQSRKRELGIVLTVQLESTVDVRYRAMCEEAGVFVIADRTPAGFSYDLWHKGEHREILLPERNARKFYPLFDTMEIVEPLEDLAHAIPTVRKEEIKKIAKAIIVTEGRDVKITHSQVKHYLQMHEHPASIEDSVYEEVKNQQKGKKSK